MQIYDSNSPLMFKCWPLWLKHNIYFIFVHVLLSVQQAARLNGAHTVRPHWINCFTETTFTFLRHSSSNLAGNPVAFCPRGEIHPLLSLPFRSQRTSDMSKFICKSVDQHLLQGSVEWLCHIWGNTFIKKQRKSLKRIWRSKKSIGSCWAGYLEIADAEKLLQAEAMDAWPVHSVGCA